MPKPLRSIPVPDSVEEHLRMARLAEAQGKRGEALAAYRKALAELKTRQAPQKVGAGGTAREQPQAGKAPSALVIRARRAAPERQTMRFTYAGDDEQGIDALLAQARAAEAAGRRQEALRMFREVSARIKAER